MSEYKKHIVRLAEGVTFNIKTDDLSKARDNEEKIIGIIATQPYYCNDLTGKLWMFDTKLGEIDGKSVWIENIHPSNDLTKVDCLVLFH